MWSFGKHVVIFTKYMCMHASVGNDGNTCVDSIWQMNSLPLSKPDQQQNATLPYVNNPLGHPLHYITFE